MNTRFRAPSFHQFTILSALCLVLSACAKASPAETPAPTELSAPTVTPDAAARGEYWPTAGWRTSTPEEQGMDGQLIQQALDAVDRDGIALHSLLIIRHGCLVSESYFWGYSAIRKHELYSVTKSFVSTLVGISIDQELIGGVDTPMTGFFPGLVPGNPDPRKDSMTLEDVLTMRTGLDWIETDSTFNAIYRSTDWAKFVLDLPMAHEPGTVFEYCSGCSHLLSAAVQKAAGTPLREFADQNLFAPLGITGFTWETSSEDIPIGGWGLSLAPRDLAKLGYLFLHGGLWDGRQIVSAGWVKEATREHTGDGGGLRYGYQWWVNPGLNAFLALGRYGQMIYVIPEKDLIIVTTAGEESHDRIFPLVNLYLLPAVETE
jgi:CubicO group peptidase (beta-lactamase class C family)